MKLKKKAKRILIILLIVVVLIAGFIIYKQVSKTTETKEVKILSEIKDYNYKLKETKPKAYKNMFYELKDILEAKKVDEEAYLKQISKMYIYDFYSLKDKSAKTDVGGVDFVYSDVLANYLLNAEDTYYKYVESNIYNNRKQDLPVVDVDSIKIEDVKQEEYAYGEKTDESAYTVNVSWKYTDDSYSDYQKEATMIFIHDGKKLCLVELQ